MTYSKPEVTVLGDPTRLIEILGKGYGDLQDGPPPFGFHPAYDLDE